MNKRGENDDTCSLYLNLQTRRDVCRWNEFFSAGWKSSFMLAFGKVKQDKQFCKQKSFLLHYKPRPNDRNMPTQHVATYCVRLATVLRCAATCWVLLAQVWKWSNLSQQHPFWAQECCDVLRICFAPNNVICCGALETLFVRIITNDTKETAYWEPFICTRKISLVWFCYAQQCCDMLHWHDVANVWLGL